MKYTKIIITILIIFAIGIILYFVFNNNNNNQQNQNPDTSSSGTRISTNLDEEKTKNRISNIIKNQNEIMQNESKKEISAYATKILDDSYGRLTNISITCSTLNNTIVRKGETFSFNNIVGEPTSEKGYQEAKVIIDHKTETGIGGGNCQVSSTLYNAVLNIPSLTIIERHEHGKDVAYVPDGKDAAVSYGSLDLKFRNDLENDIMIEASTDNQTITIKLFEI